MPMYACHGGYLREQAITEAGIFAVTDTKGRHWYCREGTEADATSDPFEQMATQRRAFEQGLATEGSIFTTLVCQKSELPRKLAEVPDPIDDSGR